MTTDKMTGKIDVSSLVDEAAQFDFHCITCSDEALPARVVSVDPATGMALVQIGGATEDVDISLVDAVAPGDTLLVHGGVALQSMAGE